MNFQDISCEIYERLGRPTALSKQTRARVFHAATQPMHISPPQDAGDVTFEECVAITSQYLAGVRSPCGPRLTTDALWSVLGWSKGFWARTGLMDHISLAMRLSALHELYRNYDDEPDWEFNAAEKDLIATAIADWLKYAGAEWFEELGRKEREVGL
jgi:hypothetical protein